MEYIEYQQYKLFYEKSGNGQKVLMIFHGFGQTHRKMKPLVGCLNPFYTCYNFDLFYHGRSTGPEEGSLQLEDWRVIVDKFLKKENINSFTLAGFSLGAKYALSIMMNMPQHVDEVFFLAPDGIKTNIWYNLATYPPYLRKYFRSMIRHPQRLFILLRTANNLGLISNNVCRFVESQMDSPDRRIQVYKTWVGLRHVKFKTKNIVQVINKHSIPVDVILGKNDKIIPSKSFKNFTNRCTTCKLTVLNTTHFGLIKAACSYISSRVSAS